MSDWFETLDGLYAQAWDQLERGVADGSHPARHPSLATVSQSGWPEARMVAIRRADRAERILEAHTDIFSDKIVSLRSNPRGAFHFWIEELRLQIRVQASVEILNGSAVSGHWAKVPIPSRQSYGTTPAPGVPIPEALSYVKDPDPASFAVLRCYIEHIDLVHLGEVHRRARFAKERDWIGEWLSP